MNGYATSRAEVCSQPMHVSARNDSTSPEDCYRQACKLLQQVNVALENVGVRNQALTQTVRQLNDLIQEAQGLYEQAHYRLFKVKPLKWSGLAETEHCRSIPLNPIQQAYFDELHQGIQAAEKGVTTDEHGSPWGSFIHHRNRIPPGQARMTFEIGYLMRIYQLFREAQRSA